MIKLEKQKLPAAISLSPMAEQLLDVMRACVAKVLDPNQMDYGRTATLKVSDLVPSCSWRNGSPTLFSLIEPLSPYWTEPEPLQTKDEDAPPIFSGNITFPADDNKGRHNHCPKNGIVYGGLFYTYDTDEIEREMRRLRMTALEKALLLLDFRNVYTIEQPESSDRLNQIYQRSKQLAKEIAEEWSALQPLFECEERLQRSAEGANGRSSRLARAGNASGDRFVTTPLCSDKDIERLQRKLKSKGLIANGKDADGHLASNSLMRVLGTKRYANEPVEGVYVVWHGTLAQLTFLIRELFGKGWIKCRNLRDRKWEVTAQHFVLTDEELPITADALRRVKMPNDHDEQMIRDCLSSYDHDIKQSSQSNGTGNRRNTDTLPSSKGLPNCQDFGHTIDKATRLKSLDLSMHTSKKDRLAAVASLGRKLISVKPGQSEQFSERSTRYVLGGKLITVKPGQSEQFSERSTRYVLGGKLVTVQLDPSTVPLTDRDRCIASMTTPGRRGRVPLPDRKGNTASMTAPSRRGNGRLTDRKESDGKVVQFSPKTDRHAPKPCRAVRLA